MGKKLTGLNPLSYLGVEPESPADSINYKFAPTTNDNEFNIGTTWIDTTTSLIYILTNLDAGIATWTLLNGTPPPPGPGFTWNNVVGGSAAMVIGNGYIANNAGLVTLTMPAAAVVGSIIRVAGNGAGGWRIAQNAGQLIQMETSTTTTGVAGYLASTVITDTVELVCTVVDTTWNVVSSMGNITVA